MKNSDLKKLKQVVSILIDNMVEINKRTLNKTDTTDEPKLMYFRGRESGLDVFKSEINSLTLKKFNRILEDYNNEKQQLNN